MAVASKDDRYRRWAAELLQIASVPSLVPLMGAHDPLDGLVEAASLGLKNETRELARLVARGRKDLHALLSQVLHDAELSATACTSKLAWVCIDAPAIPRAWIRAGTAPVQPPGEHVDVSRVCSPWCLGPPRWRTSGAIP